MKFRDALLAGSEHGADRLPTEIDRRLRRRLGLDASPSRRRVWLRPAIGAFAVAAIALIFMHFRATPPTDYMRNEINVRTDGPAATVLWGNATIVATPGTRLTTSTTDLYLAHGAIQIQRTDATPMLVMTPTGRVVIAAYRSSVSAERESVTIFIADGTGDYIDPSGQTHPLVPNAPLVWPPPTEGQRETRLPDASVPAPMPPARKRAHVDGRSSVAPAPVAAPEQAAPMPSVPNAPDVPCTFKSDCDPGTTCRKNESGASVCMGNGGDGAACWFDGDCVSQRCVQRRCQP